MKAYKVGCSVMNLTILLIFQVILYAKKQLMVPAS